MNHSFHQFINCQLIFFLKTLTNCPFLFCFFYVKLISIDIFFLHTLPINSPYFKLQPNHRTIFPAIVPGTSESQFFFLMHPNTPDHPEAAYRSLQSPLTNRSASQYCQPIERSTPSEPLLSKRFSLTVPRCCVEV